MSGPDSCHPKRKWGHSGYFFAAVITQFLAYFTGLTPWGWPVTLPVFLLVPVTLAFPALGERKEVGWLLTVFGALNCLGATAALALMIRVYSGDW